MSHVVRTHFIWRVITWWHAALGVLLVMSLHCASMGVLEAWLMFFLGYVFRYSGIHKYPSRPRKQVLFVIVWELSSRDPRSLTHFHIEFSSSPNQIWLKYCSLLMPGSPTSSNLDFNLTLSLHRFIASIDIVNFSLWFKNYNVVD